MLLLEIVNWLINMYILSYSENLISMVVLAGDDCEQRCTAYDKISYLLDEEEANLDRYIDTGLTGRWTDS